MSAGTAAPSADRTVVHLLRHGEVHNPDGILYGRLPGYRLSARGRAMAERIATSLADRDIVHLRVSPLERARETVAPLAATLGITPEIDDRVIESSSKFEGTRFAINDGGALGRPLAWRHLRNPVRPSWGEPYGQIAARMLAGAAAARDAARGHEAVVVSHQLPIWTTRLRVEGKSVFLHDPRRRQCTLCSLTSLHYEGDRLVRLTYSEPAGDMIPARDKKSPFSSGGRHEEPVP
ncbi:histidine phosphatase family protein [Nocardioides sp. CFH 31398]|uniref:histidine phosphatase family protein n=1 Tax=Nocardioides sp. CFH 31398 TaxID=2919579 RepID=UPI001F06550B|nr:histidine phosphatase family protein [Nocardioides sp. CFH 31398]MCH1865150.1 histidine phosphatase family protein [Nocardioides sp. CFH 31398]